MPLLQTWRWFGPEDPVSLNDIKQSGARAVVSALHSIPYGKVWPYEEILSRKQHIEKAGLTWKVIESIPVHDDIKLMEGRFQHYIENYKTSIRNAARAGIKTICYNFMLLLDWSRTNLDFPMEDGSTAMSFRYHELVGFHMTELVQGQLPETYSQETLEASNRLYSSLSNQEKNRISEGILAGFWSNTGGDQVKALKNSLFHCQNIKKSDLRAGLANFLKEIIPVAEEEGVKMAIHPDDPPFPIFGLPRIASTEEDLDYLLGLVKSSSNGLTFCTGSLGAWENNNLVSMINKYHSNIFFVHLRNVKRESSHDFYESDHLVGDVDMYEIMKSLIINKLDLKEIPMRPDHGHRMLDDLDKKVIAGYSAIGRLRGLAELRGLEMGIKRSLPL